MRRPDAIQLGLAVLLVLSVWLKVAGERGGAAQAEMAPRPSRLAAQLTAAGFSLEPALTDRDPVLQPAVRAGCRLAVAEVSPLGWERDALSQIVKPDQRLAFAFQGTVYGEQPVWRTSFQHHLNLALGYVGLPRGDEAVYAVIAGRSCGDLATDWLTAPAADYSAATAG